MPGVESRFGQFMFWIRSRTATLFGGRQDNDSKLRIDLISQQKLFSRPLDPKSRQHSWNTYRTIELLKQVREQCERAPVRVFPRAFGELLRSPYFLQGVLAYPSGGSKPFGTSFSTLHSEYLSLLRYGCDQDLMAGNDALELLLGRNGRVPDATINSYMYFVMSFPHLGENVVQQMGLTLKAAFDAELKHGGSPLHGELQWMRALLGDLGYGYQGDKSLYRELCDAEFRGERSPMRLEALATAGLIPDRATIRSVLPAKEAEELIQALHNRLVRPRLRSLSTSSAGSSPILPNGVQDGTREWIEHSPFESTILPIGLSRRRHSSVPTSLTLLPYPRTEPGIKEPRRAHSEGGYEVPQLLSRPEDMKPRKPASSLGATYDVIDVEQGHSMNAGHKLSNGSSLNLRTPVDVFQRPAGQGESSEGRANSALEGRGFSAGEATHSDPASTTAQRPLPPLPYESLDTPPVSPRLPIHPVAESESAGGAGAQEVTGNAPGQAVPQKLPPPPPPPPIALFASPVSTSKSDIHASVVQAAQAFASRKAGKYDEKVAASEETKMAARPINEQSDRPGQVELWKAIQVRSNAMRPPSESSTVGGSESGSADSKDNAFDWTDAVV